jgi:cytochrome o ubiquinol oxidase subunit 1
MASGGFVMAWLVVIARSFVRDTRKVISATEVERVEKRWLREVALTRPASRDDEFTCANKGLAETTD